MGESEMWFTCTTGEVLREERDIRAPNILEVMGGSVEPRSIFGARFLLFCTRLSK
jgi:hypothetical protein